MMSFEREILGEIADAAKRLDAASINAQSQLSPKQCDEFLKIMRDLSMSHANTCAIHAVNLLEQTSTMLQSVGFSNAEDKARVQRLCAVIDQFVSLVKQGKA